MAVDAYITVHGRILGGENLAQFAKIFSANAHQCSETTENLPSGSPRYSSTFTTQVSIRPNFTP